ncbi:sigma-54-dependent Fis family transcriptional regulator [Sorangium cellulosum]|uniref:Fis family transcriptional regulator n=1 Tax=Sorangium cellulosum So0157-2 TaxID=1254432 RepID=S4XMZ6_SORCE|nr:sigma-54-dependent Fis family transcriptional regulator [Sorangium cellulosum]AGP32048.1 Fis family transcriptional regulator [Sorangium cellulosum So0157-2]
MRAADLDLSELLTVDPQAGELRFSGARAILLDAVAMGLLRKQLIDALGAAAARAILTRFGFAHGFRTAEAARAELPLESDEEWRNAGGRIHALQGMIRLAPGADGPLSPEGATVEASYEAEQHLLHLGRAESPVCWTLAGFASGYLSCVEGRDIYVIERRCLGRGDASCLFAGRTAEAWGAELDPHLPFFQEDRLDTSLRRAAEALGRAERRLKARAETLLRTAAAPVPGGIAASSPAMQRVLELARRVAQVDATVLITGESGTGKERVARLVHDASPRARAAMLAINCAAIPEPLIESELFGHARGAFTGATRDRAGIFEAAAGGTLFLDEVGELPAGVQVKLLRALQAREVRRVGENRSRPVDVRVVAATNRELAAEVASGRFRKDLYYRLKVVELRLPPLRERREDILPLARALLAQAAARMRRPAPRLSPGAADRLVRYAWPGNVRELENAMERAVALAEVRRVEADDLPEEVRSALRPSDAGPRAPAPEERARTLVEVEKEHILAALARNGGNQTRTAAELGIGVSTLYRKLKEYGRAP